MSRSSMLDKAVLLKAFFAVRLAADTLCVVLDPTELTLSGAGAVACRLRDAAAVMPSIALLFQGTEGAAETLEKLVQMLIETGAGTKYKPMSEKDATAFLLLAVPAFLQLKAARQTLRSAVLGPSTKKPTGRRSAFREPAPEPTATVTTEGEEKTTVPSVILRDKKEKKRKKKEREKSKKAAAKVQESAVVDENQVVRRAANVDTTVPARSPQQEKVPSRANRPITFLPAAPAGRKKPPRVPVQRSAPEPPPVSPRKVLAPIVAAAYDEFKKAYNTGLESLKGEMGIRELSEPTSRLLALGERIFAQYGEDHLWAHDVQARCLVQAGRLFSYQGQHVEALEAGSRGLAIWRRLVEPRYPMDQLHAGFAEAMSVVLHAVDAGAASPSGYEQLARECIDFNQLFKTDGPSPIPAYLDATGLSLTGTRGMNPRTAENDQRKAACVLALAIQERAPAEAIEVLQQALEYPDPDDSDALRLGLRGKLEVLWRLHHLQRKHGNFKEALQTAIERDRVTCLLRDSSSSLKTMVEVFTMEHLQQARKEEAQWQGRQGAVRPSARGEGGAGGAAASQEG